MFPSITGSFVVWKTKISLTKELAKGFASQFMGKVSSQSNQMQKIGLYIIIKKEKQGQMIKEEQIEGEYEQSNQSVEFQYLTNKNYEELLGSHQLAKKFISELGDLRKTPVCESLLSYVRDLKFIFKSCDFVVELMESRLNKMIKNNKIKKNWSEEDLHILVWFLSKYMEKNSIQSHQAMTKNDWERLSALIPGSTPRSCMFKFVSLKKFKLAQHKWQKDEDYLLYKIIAQIGTRNWKTISERLYQQGSKKKIYRTAKQCREHWSCYLDPKIKKGPWDQQQDRKLLHIVLQSNCQKKWSLIKQQFEGRTENALKNRFTLLLDKQKKLNPHLEKQTDLIHQILKDKEETSQQQGKSQRQPKRQSVRNSIAIPEPIFPQEERRNVQIFNPGYIIVFNGSESKLASVPLNTWFFQM